MASYSIVAKSTDCGRYGKAMEEAIKAFFGYVVRVSSATRPDLRRGGHCYEVKGGAGEVEKLYTSSQPYVIFVPVPAYTEEPAGFDRDGVELVKITVDVERCEGFIFERETFLQGMEAINAIRPAKKGTDGIYRHCIQTYWNHKKQAPHGKLLEKIIDFGYGEGFLSFEDWLEADPKAL